MAFFDDKKMLISHIRHSFVTNDETGMCELIMVNEDIDREIENDQTFHKKSMRMRQRYKDKGTHQSLPIGAVSYDIKASPSLPRKPPANNNSNMFEAMEERKKKKPSKSTHIVWQETPHENIDRSLFVPQPIKKQWSSAPSPLTKLLAEQARKTSNPFYGFRKFNGENHGMSSTNVYSMFLAMAKDPLKPVVVTVLHNATVENLIGLTFWKFLDEEREKISFKPVTYYSVMIAEDDGEIDTDLPELQREDYIAKFGFKYLGIVERSSPVQSMAMEEAEVKHKIVKVFYENGGFSKIAVDSLDIEMSEILTKVIRKRRLQIQGYELEPKGRPGQFVELSSTLKSQGTMDFVLKHIPRHSSIDEEDDDTDSSDRRYTHVRVQLTSHQYKSFNVTMLHRVRSNTKVQLGVDYEHLEIQPIDQSGRGFMKFKPVRYEIQDIQSSVLLNEEKPSGVCAFRITRMTKEGPKNMDFEAVPSVAREIVEKIGLILKDSSTSFKIEIDEQKEKEAIKRKASRSKISS